MESIEGFVAEQLAAWEVPGCAVAAVRDGAVVLAGGWGWRDVKTDLPVTPGTLFAIGSVTKAFTAATVGALVDDGLLDWTRPLRDYLPDLRLHDPVVTDRVSVVDFLSHRSGLPRHDITALTVPFELSVEPLRFDRLPDTRVQDPEVLSRLCGTYVMGPIEIAIARRDDQVLTATTPGAPPFELQPGRGLRFGVKNQPGVSAEFELDESGAVVRLIVQPLGIFRPKTSEGEAE